MANMDYEKSYIVVTHTFHVFALSACNSSQNAETTETTGYTVSEESNAAKEESSSTQQDENGDTETMKVLVAYFSRTGENYGVGHIEKGNTHIIADMIAEQVDADLFEISTVVHIPMNTKLVQKPQGRSRKKMLVPNCQLPWKAWKIMMLSFSVTRFGGATCRWQSTHFLRVMIFRERQSFRSVPTKAVVFLPPTAALLKSAQVQMFWMD